MTYMPETGLILLKGDMVMFHAPEIFSDAERRYKNPGVVMKVEQRETFVGVLTTHAKVYWADGKITKEHSSYLKKISVSDFDGT